MLQSCMRLGMALRLTSSHGPGQVMTTGAVILSKLTPRVRPPMNSTLAHSDPLSAPATEEIEITDEMVSEGIRALPWLPSEMLDIHPARSLVSEVYLAMCRCAPKKDANQ